MMMMMTPRVNVLHIFQSVIGSPRQQSGVFLASPGKLGEYTVFGHKTGEREREREREDSETERRNKTVAPPRRSYRIRGEEEEEEEEEGEEEEVRVAA